MTKYETVIGLEIHAELATKTKLFCSCRNDPFHAPEPNLYICPVCLALPGSLPVMNRQAVLWAALVGLAVGSEIGWPSSADSQTKDLRSTKWDRKNYFYPDLPKGYQISQYDLPIDHRGSLPIGDNDIEITRIHLEEDTGKLIHPAGTTYSLIDYNRAGVPLLELVTEPVLRSGAAAAAFAQLYQLVLRTLGVARADMEKGELRVEANISVRPVGSTTFGTKVEVKNLNSFKSVERAIAFETDRQIANLERGESIIQETRGWNETKQETFRQRVKETAADYRYFPEPDLPPVTLTGKGQGIDVDQLRTQLPELPWNKTARFSRDYGLSASDARRLVYDPEKSTYFEEIATVPGTLQVVANWILNDVADTTIPPAHLRELAELLADKTITTKLAKELLPKLRSTNKSPRAIIKDEGFVVVRDTSALESLVHELITDHPQAANDYRAGKVSALGFLVGQAMAKTRGQADPSLLREVFEKILGEQ